MDLSVLCSALQLNSLERILSIDHAAVLGALYCASTLLPVMGSLLLGLPWLSHPRSMPVPARESEPSEGPPW